MRLVPIAPDNLHAKQRPLFDQIKAQTDKHMPGFIKAREDGALVGPFNPMIHFPQFGHAAWRMNVALSEHSTLPKTSHEVAILMVGARFAARYELYAHEAVGSQAGLSPAKIATIAAGQRPVDLTEEEASAYDVASVLIRGGQLPESTYRRALDLFEQDGVAELIYLVGFYCLISVLLNGYDVDIPGSDESVAL